MQTYHDLKIRHSSESNEWYTPPEYIDAVHQVMGGIDLDPASSEIANRTVNADRYFAIENDGLSQAWRGRVFLNPPYGKIGGKSQVGAWTAKLIRHSQAGDVTDAILLVKVATDTKWFQPLWRFHLCFTNHRIQFIKPDGQAGKAPAHGHVFVYLGLNSNRFKQAFSRFGAVVSPSFSETNSQLTLFD